MAAAVSELLEGSGEPEAETGTSAPEEAEQPLSEPENEPAALETLADAAERLGVDAKDVYNLKLNTGDGEEVTVGQMKDLWQTKEAIQRESAERETALDQRESAISQELQLWSELGDQLQKNLNPQQLSQLQGAIRQRADTERRKMLTAIPEFNDEATYDQFRQEATDFLVKEYGFAPHEANVGDHRHVRIIRDFIRLKKRMEALSGFKPKSKVPEARTAPKGRGTAPSGRKQLISKARGGSETQKVAAVTKLLGG